MSDRHLEAIRTITEETGYPPSPEELAEVLGVSLTSLHLSIRNDKRSGAIRYDDDGNLTVSA